MVISGPVNQEEIVPGEPVGAPGEDRGELPGATLLRVFDPGSRIMLAGLA